MPQTKNMQTKLLALLKRRHVGQDNAVPSRALEARFSVCGSSIRRAVLRLRRGGEPVCSDRFGYYYTKSGVELWDTIGRMERRVVASAQVVRGLRSAATQIPDSGQTRLAEHNGGDYNQ